MSVTVNSGDSVKWVNVDAFNPHTTTQQSGPESWDKTLNPGESFSRVFSAPGSYSYWCTIHANTGTVTVNG